MKAILKILKIDETLTQAPKKDTIFSKIKNNVPHESHLNYMADLIFLPKTKNNYIGLLVVVDLGTEQFDIQPIINKESETVLKAFQEMIKRKEYINIPYYSLQTDGGNEFQDKFDKFLFNKNIYHKITLAYRHQQNSMVESLNKQLGRIFNGYMNYQEFETGKRFKEWDEIIDDVRIELNKHRRIQSINPRRQNLTLLNTELKPKFKINDIVYIKNEIPLDALGNPQPTKTFRIGDLRWYPHPKTIIQIIHDADVGFRYIVSGIKNTSFTENEIKLAKNQKNAKYEVKKIIGKKKENNKIYYLVWWKKYLKKDSTYELKTTLIEDGLQNMINDYEKSIKQK